MMNHEPESGFSPEDAPAFGGCVTGGWPGAAACCASCCS